MVVAMLLFNPLSPNIHIQILQNWSLYVSFMDGLREFDKRSRHFLLGDQLINSHSLISGQSMDMVKRKLMLVTIGT